MTHKDCQSVCGFCFFFKKMPFSSLTLLQTTTSNQYQQHPKGAPTGTGRKKITTVREVKEEEGKKKNHDGTRSGGRRRIDVEI